MNELKLLKGDPQELNNGLKIYPLTLGEIADLGEQKYNQYISTVAINKDVLGKVISSASLTKEEIEEINKSTCLDCILFLGMQDPTILSTFFEALSIFLKSDIDVSEGILVIQNDQGSYILDAELFEEIKTVIFKQNFLKDSNVSSFKPANSKAQQLMEKLQKVKEKIQKQNKEEHLDLKDIISIVSAYSTDINIMTVWDLTVCQLFEAYTRLIIWDEYHTKYTLLPHTSDSSSLDLKHWATNINNTK
ncbi:hypothetical protein [Bacillus infantis]|uniref:hypothetical protein n=1 Tax=Bacillus infantis TaxID=324767 RepID=UPI003CEC307A